MGLYAGDITAADAWDLLSREQGAVLVDVRTSPEWKTAGVPDLSSIKKEAVFLSWRNYPNYDVNENFIAQIDALNIPKDEKIIFLCKVGGRSAEAAMTMSQLGYTNCYNFIGGMDDKSGWKESNLPWGLAA